MTKLKPDAVAREQMEGLLRHFDPRSDNVPKRIDPAFVETFARDVLAKTRPNALAANMLVMIADFYGVTSLVDDFMPWLDRTEQDDDHFQSSLALTRGVGLLGDDIQRAEGQRYFDYLLGLPFAEERMPDLLEAHGVYALHKSTKVTELRIGAIIADLQAREASDPGAGRARRDMEDLRGVTLPRVEAAAAMQRDVLALDADGRRERLVDLYLGLDLSYYEELRRWVARALQGEARAAGNVVIVSAFRAALGRLDQGKHDTQPVPIEAVDARRRKALAAIELFEGALSAEEEGQLRLDEKRLELLSTEP